jgi:hypothetical protein
MNNQEVKKKGVKIDFFLSPEILKLGKSDPRVKMFFGDKIKFIEDAKKEQKKYKKEQDSLVRIIKQKI